jgi:hypothetical protein
VIDVIFAREIVLRHCPGDHVEEARMAVRVYNSRDHGLAGKIDPARATRRENLTLPADLREAVADNQQRGILNRGRAVTRN